MPPDDNKDDLLFKRRDAFDLAVLGPDSGVAPLLYRRAKSLKSLEFDGMLRGRSFVSHMTERHGTRGKREGRATWIWRGSTLGS